MSRRRKDPLRALSTDERSGLARLSRSQRASAAQVARATALLAVADGRSYLDGTVKLMLARIEKRRRSSALWPHAAASAPVISAQIANACARTARYSAAGR